MPECGIEGWARVLGIGKCPLISPRPGPEFQLVTATFKHHAKQILDVYIADETDAIGTTPNHPFWSHDKQKFIRADELTAGEQVQKANGTLTTVTHVVPRAGTNTVYNLEVQCTHTYHVGNSGVLVHNSKPCDEFVTLYHGSKGGLSGGRFSLDRAISGKREFTPKAGVYLTDDFTRAAQYGRHGTVSRVRVPKEFADRISQMGGPGNKKVPEFFVDSIDDLEELNRGIRTLPTPEAFQQFIKGIF